MMKKVSDCELIKKLDKELNEDIDKLIHSHHVDGRRVQTYNANWLVTRWWARGSIIPDEMFDKVCKRNGLTANSDATIPDYAGDMVEDMTFAYIDNIYKPMTLEAGIAVLQDLTFAIKRATPEELKSMKRQFYKNIYYAKHIQCYLMNGFE